MFFVQQVAFLVRILVRKCKKSKQVKKPFAFSRENIFAFIFKDYFFQNPYVLSVFFRPRLFREGGLWHGQAQLKEKEPLAFRWLCFGNQGKLRTKYQNYTKNIRKTAFMQFFVLFCYVFRIFSCFPLSEIITLRSN